MKAEVNRRALLLAAALAALALGACGGTRPDAAHVSVVQPDGTTTTQADARPTPPASIPF